IADQRTQYPPARLEIVSGIGGDRWKRGMDDGDLPRPLHVREDRQDRSVREAAEAPPPRGDRDLAAGHEHGEDDPVAPSVGIDEDIASVEKDLSGSIEGTKPRLAAARWGEQQIGVGEVAMPDGA